MNQNRLNKYNETNVKIFIWALFIIFLISIPIFMAHPLKLHTPEPFGQPADLHPDTLPKLIRTVSRFIFGQF